MALQFTFTPDDGPAQEILVPDAPIEDLDLIKDRVAHNPDGAFVMDAKVIGEDLPAISMVFRGHRISNVRAV